jgi:hypothetical protein
MIAVTSIFILLLTAISILLLHYLKQNFSYHWFIGTLGVFISWFIMLVFRGGWTLSLSTNMGNSNSLFQEKFELIFDKYSWFYSIAIVTLLFSALLTSEARSNSVSITKSSSNSIATIILLTVVTLLALAGGNIFTMLILWAAADIVDLLFWLSRLDDYSADSSLTRTLSVRLISLAILFWAMLLMTAGQIPDSFSSLPPEISTLLILAAGFRLGVLPPLSITSRDGHIVDKTEVFQRILSFGPALMLLTRSASGGEFVQNPSVWLIFALIALLHAGFSWLGAAHAQMDLSFWTFGVGALAVTAAITLHPEASLIWGLVFLLLGGFFSLYSVHLIGLKPLVWISIFSLTSLPLTPTWIGSQVFDSPRLIWIGLLFGQSLLIASLIRFRQKDHSEIDLSERWIKTFHILGLALMPIILIALNLIFLSTSIQDILSLINLDSVLPGLVITTFSITLIIIQWLSPNVVRNYSSHIGQILGLNWLYSLLNRFVALIQKGILLTNLLLEGQAGIIWAVLFLVLLFTLINYPGFGE